MSRTRVISNVENVFVGPTPSTGFHFLDMSTFGAATSANIYGPAPTAQGNGNTGVNLIVPLNRIIDASYSFNISRVDLFQYGEQGAISREAVEAPTVNLQFSY